MSAPTHSQTNTTHQGKPRRTAKLAKSTLAEAGNAKGLQRIALAPGKEKDSPAASKHLDEMCGLGVRALGPSMAPRPLIKFRRGKFSP